MRSNFTHVSVLDKVEVKETSKGEVVLVRLKKELETEKDLSIEEFRTIYYFKNPIAWNYCLGIHYRSWTVSIGLEPSQVSVAMEKNCSK